MGVCPQGYVGKDQCDASAHNSQCCGYSVPGENCGDRQGDCFCYQWNCRRLSSWDGLDILDLGDILGDMVHLGIMVTTTTGRCWPSRTTRRRTQVMLICLQRQDGQGPGGTDLSGMDLGGILDLGDILGDMVHLGIMVTTTGRCWPSRTTRRRTQVM